MQYRQGDIFIEQIAALPKDQVRAFRRPGDEPVPLAVGRAQYGSLILARSLVTGYAHTINEQGVELFLRDSASYFVFSAQYLITDLHPDVRFESLSSVLPREAALLQRGLSEQESDDELFEATTSFECWIRVQDRAVVRHERHDPISLGPGIYHVYSRREYSPNGGV